MSGWVKHYHARLNHLKLLKAGPLATHLDDQAILWCNEHLTDGLVPAQQVSRLVNWADVLEANGSGRPKPVDPMKLAERLVAVGRWELAEDGFQVHDYLDVQRSAAEIQAGRAADAKRKRGGK